MGPSCDVEGLNTTVRAKNRSKGSVALRFLTLATAFKVISAIFYPKRRSFYVLAVSSFDRFGLFRRPLALSAECSRRNQVVDNSERSTSFIALDCHCRTRISDYRCQS